MYLSKINFDGFQDSFVIKINGFLLSLNMDYCMQMSNFKCAIFHKKNFVPRTIGNMSEGGATARLSVTPIKFRATLLIKKE